MEGKGKSSNDAKTDQEPRLILGPNLSQSRTNLPLFFSNESEKRRIGVQTKSREKKEEQVKETKKKKKHKTTIVPWV